MVPSQDGTVPVSLLLDISRLRSHAAVPMLFGSVPVREFEDRSSVMTFAKYVAGIDPVSAFEPRDLRKHMGQVIIALSDNDDTQPKQNSSQINIRAGQWRLILARLCQNQSELPVGGPISCAQCHQGARKGCRQCARDQVVGRVTSLVYKYTRGRGDTSATSEVRSGRLGCSCGGVEEECGGVGRISSTLRYILNVSTQQAQRTHI